MSNSDLSSTPSHGEVQSNTLERLPAYVWLHHVLPHASAKSAVDLATCSKRWRALISTEALGTELWRFLLERDFGVRSEAQHASHVRAAYKRLFVAPWLPANELHASPALWKGAALPRKQTQLVRTSYCAPSGAHIRGARQHCAASPTLAASVDPRQGAVAIDEIEPSGKMI